MNRKSRLRLEQLESRRLLATIPVASGDGFELGLDDSQTFAVLQLPQAEYDEFDENPTFADTAKLVYESFEDEFDFLIFVMNQDEPTGGRFGLASNVVNDTSGIGMSLFDRSDQFGTAGRLQSVIQLSALNGIRGGPSLHEILHRWANGFDEFGSGAHWGFSNVGGQLGGWQPGTLQFLEDVFYEADGPGGSDSFSTFANGGNGIPFSEFELYLMGLIEAEEISHPLRIAREAGFVNFSAGIFGATSIETITIEELIATHGRRTPAPADSQREFRALTVLVTPEPVSDDVADQLAADIDAFTLNSDEGTPLFNFWEATGGRATMRMDGLFHTIGRQTPWQNPLSIFDVNHDGRTTSLDALLIINEIARRNGNKPLGPEPENFEEDFFDVTGDGDISALDALRVINELARQPATESTLATVMAPAMEMAALTNTRLLDEIWGDPQRQELLF